MFPPVVGAMMLLGSFGITGLGMIGVVAGKLRGTPRWTQIGGRLVGAAVTGYGLLWLVGLLGSPRRALAIGEEVSFCGVDCHLHVSVVRIERGNDLGVVLRFRSDAKQANEYPGLLRLRVIDSAGRGYLPSDGVIAEPLGAGATIEREFRFTVPPAAGAPALVVSYDGWLDYLVPGRGNPLAQRRIRLSLDRA